MTITIVYDNQEYDPRLQPDWGFSCLVQAADTTLLFDTGGNGDILLSNMATLGLDPLAVDHVMLSHIHGDHTGGLAALLATGVQPLVWVPSSFPVAFKDQIRSRTQVREVSGPAQLVPGAHTTCELGSDILEQSLILEASGALVVITGCAHPGIVNVLTRVKELHAGDLLLLVGGLHLRDKSRTELSDIISQISALAVQQIAPSHCTGETAIRLFPEERDPTFVRSGVGRTMDVDR